MKRKFVKGMAAFLAIASISSTGIASYAADVTNSPASDSAISASSSNAASARGKYDEIYLGEAQVTASVLNVRSGPGTGYRVVGKLKKGTWVSFYSVSNDKPGWTYITYGNKLKGYVASRYLGNEDPASLGELK